VSDNPETRPTLLLRLRDAQDHGAWRQFVQIYSPLIYRYALKRGLQAADSADVAQEVLRTVAKTIGTWDYDPRTGKFRGWLFTVARSKLVDFANQRRRSPQGTGDSDMREILENQVEANEDEAFWEHEYQRRVFQWAAEQVRGQFQPATWDAFWRTAVENEEASAVARSLGIAVGAVYVAKSRVLAKLKEKVRELGDEVPEGC
jgi:RNA polymerase sigma-70 factor (ECF subfamily)